MAARKNTERIDVYQNHGAMVLDMGEIEIWDGADLSLIRDMLFVVIDKKGARKVAIEMSYVKYVPSGFFGMLFDWFDKGVEITLLSPQPNVLNMLWCKRFFLHAGNHVYQLYVGPESAIDEGVPADESVWDHSDTDHNDTDLDLDLEYVYQHKSI